MGRPVMPAEAAFREASAQPRVEQVPWAHLSIELGHLYMEDYQAGPEALRRHFAAVAPWAATAAEVCTASLAGRRPRISTCFLVDDYFAPFGAPRGIVPELIDAAAGCGLRIDYLARESGCAEADGVSLARLVEGLLVAEPTPRTTGARPPVTETGWLSNGQRSPHSPAGTQAAMGRIEPWLPPLESAANRHSIFLDVELWDERGERRTWSCPFLAAVWQLLRLGMLRDTGRRVAVPRPWHGDFPMHWDELPAVVQLNPAAAPFTAYRTFSVLAPRFMPIEHAVRLILNQVATQDGVAAQALDRGLGENLALPAQLVERVAYAFVG